MVTMCLQADPMEKYRGSYTGGGDEIAKPHVRNSANCNLNKCLANKIASQDSHSFKDKFGDQHNVLLPQKCLHSNCTRPEQTSVPMTHRCQSWTFKDKMLHTILRLRPCMRSSERELWREMLTRHRTEQPKQPTWRGMRLEESKLRTYAGSIRLPTIN